MHKTLKKTKKRTCTFYPKIIKQNIKKTVFILLLNNNIVYVNTGCFVCGHNCFTNNYYCIHYKFKVSLYIIVYLPKNFKLNI